MRLLSKCLVVAMVGILFCGSWALAAPEATVPKADDISGHWAEGYIKTLRSRGIMSGYPDGTFKPDGRISREEFIALLAKAKGLSSSGGAPSFKDVDAGRWSYPYVQALVEAGILHPEDYGGHLDPGAAITRTEIVTMLVRAAGLGAEVNKTADLVSFADEIPSWAKPFATVALNHGLMSGYEDGTFRPRNKATRAEAGLTVLRLLDAKLRPATWVERYTYRSKSGTKTLKVVRVNLNRDDVVIKPALAGTIKDTAYLEDIAKNNGAVAAINGTFFSAYSNTQGDFGEPYNTLLIDGQWVHFTYTGTTLGITADKRVLMAPIRMAVSGSTSGPAGTWTAWSFNHSSPDIIGIFNRYRGKTTQMSDGVTFTVRNGRIVSKGEADVPIPDDGYVIFVSNSRINKWTDSMFPVGGMVDYAVKLNNHDDSPYPGASDWRNVRQAIGCGPRLVADGRMSVNPQAEGYTEAKQTTLPGARSAVGVTKDNIVMFVTCNSVTPQELGEAMADLGAYNAMQMDSGASSCLWYEGKYLTPPGRRINNCLIVTVTE